MLSRSATAAVTTLCLLFAASAAHADSKRAGVDRAVRQALASGAFAQKVIITVKPGCRAAVRDGLVRHGDVVGDEFALIDAIAAEIHSRDVEGLAASACVRAISADATVQASDRREARGNRRGHTSTDEARPANVLSNTLRDTLGLPHRAELSPSTPTGRGIGVAIVDSGIAPSDDFAGRISAFYDFTRGRGRRPSRPYDDFGHGTHIAGLIASSGRLTGGEFQGVAPGAHLAVFKVLDRTGAGKTSDVIRAIEFIVSNRAALDVQVINLSLGHPIYAPAADDPLVRAVERATAAGLVVVASAGNFGQKQTDGSVGYAGITSPGNAPSAITVGAAMTKDTVSRVDDEVAPYSSRGPTWFDARVKPDVVAPGHRLASDTDLSSHLYGLLDGNRGWSREGERLLLLSGASMATAVTSGVVAVALEAYEDGPFSTRRAARTLSPNLVKGILQYSAIVIDGADYLTQGAGQVNAAGAITLASVVNTSLPPGRRWLAGFTPSSLIGDTVYDWSRHIVYGDRVLAGSVLDTNHIVWSSNIVWGTAQVEGENIVWGTALVEADNIVWGSHIVWSSNIVWSNRVVGQRVDGTNIVWGSDIVWGTLEFDNIVWGTLLEQDNIVWGTFTRELDNIVWGTGIR